MRRRLNSLVESRPIAATSPGQSAPAPASASAHPEQKPLYLQNPVAVAAKAPCPKRGFSHSPAGTPQKPPTKPNQPTIVYRSPLSSLVSLIDLGLKPRLPTLSSFSSGPRPGPGITFATPADLPDTVPALPSAVASHRAVLRLGFALRCVAAFRLGLHCIASALPCSGTSYCTPQVRRFMFPRLVLWSFIPCPSRRGRAPYLRTYPILGHSPGDTFISPYPDRTPRLYRSIHAHAMFPCSHRQSQPLAPYPSPSRNPSSSPNHHPHSYPISVLYISPLYLPVFSICTLSDSFGHF